jgi:hypothetical protein
MSLQFLRPLFDHPNNIGVTKNYKASHYPVFPASSLKSKCIPLHPVLTHLPAYVLPLM